MPEAVTETEEPPFTTILPAAKAESVSVMAVVEEAFKVAPATDTDSNEVKPVQLVVVAVTVDALFKLAVSMFLTVAKAGTVMAPAAETTKESVPAPPSNLSAAVHVAAPATSEAVKVSLPDVPTRSFALVVSVMLFKSFQETFSLFFNNKVTKKTHSFVRSGFG